MGFPLPPAYCVRANPSNTLYSQNTCTEECRAFRTAIANSEQTQSFARFAFVAGQPLRLGKRGLNVNWH